VLATCGAVASAGVARRQVARTCSLRSMTLRRGPLVSEKTGAQATLPLVITEHASTSCVLDGYPSVALVDRHGRVLPLQYTHRGDEMITAARPKPVRMRVRTSAYFALNKTGCDVHPTRFARTLRVRLSGSRHARTIRLQHYPILDYCGRGVFGRVAVSPFEQRRSGWACDSQGSCQRRRR
jgi:hypothetical protein